MRLASRWCELSLPLSPLLIGALKRSAGDEHPSVRALVLRLLPFLLHHHKELGWQLFSRAIANGSAGCWKQTYGCLYYNYFNDFDRVSVHLDALLGAGHEEALKVWAGISSLAYLAERIEFSALVGNLRRLDHPDSWAAASRVFAANLTDPKSFNHCINGIMAAFAHATDTSEVAVAFSDVFREKQRPAPRIPLDTLTLFFTAIANAHPTTRSRVYGLEDWLASMASMDPECGLSATELMIGTLDPKDHDLLGSDSYLVLLTLLFREAEESELSDGGVFLNRVIAVQDFFLLRGLHKLDDWLRSAEDRA